MKLLLDHQLMSQQVVPNNNQHLTFTGRVRSMRYAFTGIWVMISSQHNAWLHAVATVIVVVAGFFFGLARAEW